jgi:hypothetical protein
VLLGLLTIAPAVVKFAETELAVSDERAHATGPCERQRLAIVVFGVLGTACCGDVTRQAEGVGLIAPIAQPPCKC